MSARTERLAPSRNELSMGEGFGEAMTGYSVGPILHNLATAWELGRVLDQFDEPLPRTGSEWTQQVRREAAL